MTTHFKQLSELEEARIRFQENVGSLLDIEVELDRKKRYAESKGKNYTSLDLEEIDLMTKHLRAVTSELLSSYDLINHITKHLIFQKNVLKSKDDSIFEANTHKGFADSIRRTLNDQAA